MPNELDNFRAKYPQYNDIDDIKLSNMLATKYPKAYGDLPAKYTPQKPGQDIGSFLETTPKWTGREQQMAEPMSVARIPGSSAIGESQGAKGLTREAMPVLRPAIEAGASIGTALVASPSTPAGMAVAGGLGYGMGSEAADLIEQWAGAPSRQQPETVVGQLGQSAKDVAFGTTMEMGGQLAVKGISASAKFAMNKLKDIGKTLPPMTKAGAEKRAGEILAAQTADGPLVAQNMAEAEALEEAIPGLKFSRGQSTGDPGIIKFERARARMPGAAAQTQLDQSARNTQAIRSFIDEQKGTAGISDVIEPLSIRREGLQTGVETAGRELEKEGAQLTGMGAVETGEVIRGAARTGKRVAQKEAGKLFEDVPEFPIDANKLISKIDELSQPSSKFEIVGKNIPEEFPQYKKVLEDAQGITTPQDLQGLRSNLTDSLRDAQSAASPNNRVISRLSQLIGEVDTVLKEAGEIADKGDLATYKGKTVNPKKIQRQLNEVTEKLKGTEELSKAKPDVDKIYSELQNKSVPGIMQQVAEPEENYVKRLVKDYQKILKKDPPMLQAKEKPMSKYLKEKKESLEKVMSGLEVTESSTKIEGAQKLKTAQQFFKKEVIEKFKTGTTGDILKKGAGGDKVSNAQIASRYFKPGRTGAEQADDFIKSVGDNKEAKVALEDYIKQDLLSASTNPLTGEIVETKLKTWLSKYKPSLKKLGLENKFDSVVKATEELNKAKDIQIAFDKSVASKILNSDVDSAVKNAFASGSKKKSAERLMRQLRGDKKAISGLQNATVDHIITNAETTATDAFNNPVLSLAKVEREFKKLKPALDVVFKDSPTKLTALNNFKKALGIMQRGKTSPLGGGSDTAENVITAMSKASGLTHSRTLNIVKALSKPLRDMGDDQVNAILNRAAFDPEFAMTLNLAAKGAPVKVIKDRLKGHLVALGLRETFKKE